MTTEMKAKIAEAQKKRWAKVRKAKKHAMRQEAKNNVTLRETVRRQRIRIEELEHVVAYLFRRLPTQELVQMIDMSEAVEERGKV
jgi:hypothetical protein